MTAESKIQQYSLVQILMVWAVAALSMGLLGWIVAPALAPDPAKPGFERLAVLTVGLAWQFALVLYLIYQENGDIRWSTLNSYLAAPAE